ncbi:MAG: FAD-binding protein [Chloroflexi bacterium]|nr:FAD-binding protein [Chloroflexota bacterium]
MINEQLSAALRQIVGRANVLDRAEELLCYSYDATPLTALPDAVVLPSTAQEIAAILQLANKERIPVVPRGAGTCLSGGPVPTSGGIVLLTARLNRILEIDTANLTATVQPGVVTADFHSAVERLGLFYPPDPASLSVSTMGGNVAEGAGGPRCFKYGTTKDWVTGLEVVLPTGEIIRTGGKTVKNVSGYDLTHLFIGSEGTLGVITEIIVRLIPLPEAKQTLLAIFTALDDAAKTVSAIVAAKIVPTTLELMDKVTIERIESYKPTGLPLDADGLLLIEVDGSGNEVTRQAELIEEIVRHCGAREIKVAQTPEESERLWEARRSAFAATARSCPTVIIEDATVPRDKVPEMVRHIRALAAKHHLAVAILAHAGDGNLHPNIMTDQRNKEELERVERFTAEMFQAALELGGTLSGEHGIGLLKSPFLEWEFGPAGTAVMRRIKSVLDPNNILNPGKMFSEN